MKSIALSAAIAALAFSVGCSKDKNPGDDDDDNTSKTISVAVTLSDNGDTNMFLGECVAFTITGTNTNFTAGSVGIQLDLPPGSDPNNSDLRTLSEDVIGQQAGQYTIDSATQITVGPNQTGSPCMLIPAFWEPGTVRLTVVDGLDQVVLDSAFTLAATEKIDLGTVASGGLATTVGNASPRANSLGRVGDIDYVLAQGDAGDAIFAFSAIHATPPSVNFFLDGLTIATQPDFFLAAFGHTAALVPNIGGVGALNAIVSEDSFRGGASGFDYEVTFQSFATGDITVLANNTDQWTGPGGTYDVITTAGLYQGDFTGKTGLYDPKFGAAQPTGGENAQPGCPNQRFSLTYDILDAVVGAGTAPEFDEATYAAGRDVVIQLDVPAGQTAYVQSMSQGVNDAGDGGDLVLYVLADPATDIPGIGAAGAGAQSAEFTGCLANVDNYGAQAVNVPVQFFGGDGLWVDNTAGGGVLTTYLFVDQFTDPTMANYADALFYLLVDYK